MFDLGDYVGKVEFFGNHSNEREWNLWHRLNEEQQRWLSRPYAISQEDTVIVMEKLQPISEDSAELSKLISLIYDQELWMQELWMDDLLYDLLWYNWGYRKGSLTPVVLDYGY